MKIRNECQLLGANCVKSAGAELLIKFAPLSDDR